MKTTEIYWNWAIQVWLEWNELFTSATILHFLINVAVIHVLMSREVCLHACALFLVQKAMCIE